MRVSTLILCLVLFSQGCWKVEETTRTSSTTLIRNNKIINNEINDHIDKLVEFEWSPYESAGIAVSRIHPHAQYLAKCSPDIIPVLIKHIDDMRPTNVENVTVGDVIIAILQGHKSLFEYGSLGTNYYSPHQITTEEREKNKRIWGNWWKENKVKIIEKYENKL